MSDPVLRLKRNVWVEPECGGELVDCRQLFCGDRNRLLLRAYPEAIRRFKRGLAPAMLAESLRSSAEIQQFYEVQESPDRVGILLRDEVFREQASLDDLAYELSIGDGVKTSSDSFPLDRLAALGQLMPLLNGDHSEPAVRAELDKTLPDQARAWAGDLLSRWMAEGLLERATVGPNFFLQSPARPRVTFVAHTSLLVQSRHTNILCDPLFRKTLGLSPEAIDAARLPLGAICLSHSHWDHTDVASLLLFDKRTFLLIPRVIQPTIFNPPMLPVLRRLGFTNIREVEHWKPIQVADVEIVPVPFHGEQDEPGAVIDHYTYVIRTNGLSLYGGVDAFRDTFGDMRSDLERVGREYQPELAFLPVSRMMYSLATGGVNGYCRSVDSTCLEKEFQYTADANLAVEWVRLLDPKLVIPYATFTFRKSQPNVEEVAFAQAMRKAGLGDRLLALRPLDAIEPDDLAQTARASVRRHFLSQWQSTAAAVMRTDRRLQGNLGYRAVKRLFRRPRPTPAHHH